MYSEQHKFTKGRRRLAQVLRRAPKLIAISDAVESLDVPRAEASRILSRWNHQGLVRRVSRGLYAPVEPAALEHKSVIHDAWLLVPSLFKDSYVGGWSAAEHWDLTEQIFRDICVISTTPIRKKEHAIHGQNFILTKFSPQWFFRLKKIWINSIPVPVSDVHKTILDITAFPVAGGGVYHVLQCLQAYSERDDADLDLLISYAHRVDTGAVFKRLGYLSELAGFPASFVDQCRDKITRGISDLTPGEPKGRIVTRWNLRTPKGWIEP